MRKLDTPQNGHVNWNLMITTVFLMEFSSNPKEDRQMGMAMDGSKPSTPGEHQNNW